MVEHASEPSPRIELDPAVLEHAPILANLLELYAHDFSEFHTLAIGADGKFGYKFLPLYWSEPNRHPFFVRVNGRLAGLALVKRGSEITGNPTVWDMAEFFILRGCRRRGLGTLAAHEVWGRFPGHWEWSRKTMNHTTSIVGLLGADSSGLWRTQTPRAEQLRVVRSANLISG
jgi:predicted acetyltransferase